jgi:Flp pilus assembly protein TadG
MLTMSMSPIWLRMRRAALTMLGDCRGIAATEFAVIVPLMLVMFFGTVEFSSGVAVSRKVTLVARTLADLASQSKKVADSDLTNFFTASNAILTPYVPTPMTSKLSELFVDATLVARVQWSKSATINSSGVVTMVTGYNPGFVVTIPSQLQVAGTYLLFSEVSYLYTPTVITAGHGYVMTSPVTLSDKAYTRPRQSACVFYPVIPSPETCPTTSLGP